MISSSRRRRRVADPVVEATALHRIVDLARAIGRDDDNSGVSAFTVFHSGIVIWKSDRTSSR